MTRPLILVVEDDPHFGRQLSDLFDFLGYRTEVAESGPAALAFVETNPVDFLLTDLMLPGMSGVELVKAMREREGGDRLPVMMMSAIYKNPRLFEKELRQLEVLEFLAKPFSLIDLGRKIDAVLDDDVELDSDAAITATGSWRLDEIEEALGEARPDFDSLGSWDRKSLVGLLNELFRRHAAGVLTLSHQKSTRAIYLLNGYPVWASSEEPEETLAAVLVDSETLDGPAAAALVRQAAEEGIDFREAVVRGGQVSERALVSAERRRVRRVLVRSFAWAGGEYEWAPGDDFVDRFPIFEVNPVPCLAEAVLRYLSVDELAAELLERSDQLFVEGSQRRQLGSYLALQDGLLGLLDAMDGGSTVGDLFTRYQAEREALVPALWLMFTLGIADSADAPPAPPQQLAVEHQPAAKRSIPPQPLFVPTPDELVGAETVRSDDDDDDEEQGILKDYLTLMQSDHYRFLGVDQSADVGAIVRAYSDRKQRYRFERLSGLSSDARSKRKELLDRLERAFTTLTAPSRRAAYDAELKAREQREATPQPGAAERLRTARALLSRGDIHQASTVLEELAVRHPNSAEVLCLLGQARHRLAAGPHELPAAREALQRALEIDPFHARSLRALAEVARGQGDERARRAAVEQVRDLDPDDPWLLSAAASE